MTPAAELPILLNHELAHSDLVKDGMSFCAGCGRPLCPKCGKHEALVISGASTTKRGIEYDRKRYRCDACSFRFTVYYPRAGVSR